MKYSYTNPTTRTVNFIAPDGRHFDVGPGQTVEGGQDDVIKTVPPIVVQSAILEPTPAVIAAEKALVAEESTFLGGFFSGLGANLNSGLST